MKRVSRQVEAEKKSKISRTTPLLREFYKTELFMAGEILRNFRISSQRDLSTASGPFSFLSNLVLYIAVCTIIIESQKVMDPLKMSLA